MAPQGGYAGNPQMMYAMQQAQAAMAAGAGRPGVPPSGSHGAAPGVNGSMGAASNGPAPGASTGPGRGSDGVDRSSYNQLKDAMAIGGVSLRVSSYPCTRSAITDRIQ